MATSAATGPTAIVCVPRSSVLAWAAPRSVIGTPVATSKTATMTDSGTSTKTEPAQRIQVEVAQLALAAQAADHRQHHGQPAGRRDELKPHDRAELAEIREMLLARIMLEVGVGHERADRVEDHGRVGPGVLDARGVLVAERRRAVLCRRGSRSARWLCASRITNESTKSAALNASSANAYCFQSICAGSRCPSSLSRASGIASIPLPTRSGGGSRTRAIHQPSGIEPAIGKPIAQNGCNKDEIQCQYLRVDQTIRIFSGRIIT